MAFTFEGINIERLVAHKIHVKGANKERVAPFTSNKLMQLDIDSKRALQRRLSEALGQRSRGIEMSITSTDPGSFFDVATRLLDVTDNFAVASHPLAHKLTDAQLGTSNAPEGVLLVLYGRVGNDQLRFIATVKGETQDGFSANESDDAVVMSYVKELLLTPAQRLYKIGILVELISQSSAVDTVRDPAHFLAFLFDHLMSATETRKAAAYFYNAFLGMSIQHSSKELTKNYFEWTKSFINASPIETEQKRDLVEALRVDLRSQLGTISVHEFAEEHMPIEIRKNYREYMTSKGFPVNAVAKDTEYIQARLRRPRSIHITTGVKISGPAENFNDLVKVLPSTEVMEDNTTLVLIQGIVQSQD